MGEGGDDAFGWSAWIPVLTCGGEMDKLRCPNFPCDYSNCVIMEVGAEWSSADGQKYKAPGFMPPPLTVQTNTAGIVGMMWPCMQFTTQQELQRLSDWTMCAPQFVIASGRR